MGSECSEMVLVFWSGRKELKGKMVGKGRRGLISVLDCIRGKDNGYGEYIKGSKEWILKTVAGGIEVGERVVMVSVEFVEKQLSRLVT